MPKIPVYDPQVSPQAQPIRASADPGAFGAGRGLEQIGGSLMEGAHQLYDVEQRQEVSDVRAKMATLRGTLTASFEEQASNTAPGDSEFGGKFMENVTNQLQALAGGTTTRAGMQAFQQESAGLTSDFLVKTTHFTTASAGAKAVADYQTTVNQNAGTLFNDPTQFNTILKSMEANYSDPNGSFAHVPVEQKAHLELVAKEQLAIAAARGVVRTNPYTAEKLYNDGHLPGQDLLTEAGNAQVVSYIQSAQSADRTKKALALAQQEHAQTMAGENAGNRILRDIVKDPTNPGITDAILNSPMKWSQKETMLNIAKHVGTGEGHDQNTFGSGFFQAYQAIHKGEITSPNQLYSRVGPEGDLTVAGVDRLTNEITGRRTPDGKLEADMKAGFVSAMKKTLSGRNDVMGIPDPKGEMIAQSALAWFLPAYEKAKGEGKYPPAVLLDPKNPNSLWAGVMHFDRDPNTKMRDMMERYQNMGEASAAPATYKSQADVTAAYKAGKIDRATAGSLLRQNGWAK